VKVLFYLKKYFFFLDWDINEDVENELIKGGQLSGDATQFNSVIILKHIKINENS